MSKSSFLPFAAVGIASVVLFAELAPGSGIGTNAGEGFMSRLMGNVSMVASDDETLMGHRSVLADYRFGTLTTTGLAFTFTDLDDPATFVPYAFHFDGTAFGPVPALIQEELTTHYTRRGGATLPEVLPQPENCTTSATGLPLCQLSAILPDARPAVIGVIQPDADMLPLTSGDDACRAEVAQWLDMPEYAGTTVALCIVMDQPFDAEAYGPTDWMDAIFYQRLGTRLLNMRAERRNFEHI